MTWAKYPLYKTTKNGKLHDYTHAMIEPCTRVTFSIGSMYLAVFSPNSRRIAVSYFALMGNTSDTHHHRLALIATQVPRYLAAG